jgi:zinc protease
MTLPMLKIARMLVLCCGVLLGLGLPEGMPQSLPPVRRLVLPNQLVVLVSEEPSRPVVTLQMLVDAGSWRDPHSEEGIAYLTAQGLLLGTSQHTIAALQEELDFMGASLNVSAQRDYSTLSLQILHKELDKGVELFLEILTQPTFPAEEIRKEVEQTLALIRSAEDQPQEVAEKAFQRALFLSEPYGHPVEGTEASLPRLTREALERFYRTYYRPNNAVLAIVGAITVEEVRTKLLPRLAAWPMGQIPAATVSTTFAPRAPTLETITIDKAITQANIVLGHAGVSRDNPDFYALTVMNDILGGRGFGSRLVKEIREKRGLAYSVASFFETSKYPGAFQIVFQTKNASAREAIALALQQMEWLRTEKVAEEELERAKNYLIGSFPFRLGTQRQLASFLIQTEYYRLGLDYAQQYPSLIRSVTRDDVYRVAQTYLHPDRALLVVVANLQEVGPE